MTEYKDRSDWTSTDASGVTLTGAILVGVAWHWPGTGDPVIGVESEAATASRLRGYRNFHVIGRNWRDIGYNVAFDQAGRVWLLRSTAWGVNMVGAHCASTSNPDANHEYAGALLILGNDEAPSAAMLAAIADWFWNRFLERWPGRTDNRGHGQVAGASTTCQGPHVRAALADGDIPGTETEDDMPLTNQDADLVINRLMARAIGAEGTPIDGWTFGHVVEAGSRWALQARDLGRTDRAAMRATLAAILAAIEGSDDAAILARIDEVAAQETAERGQILTLLEQHAEGMLDAAAVVEGVRDLIHAGTAPPA